MVQGQVKEGGCNKTAHPKFAVLVNSCLVGQTVKSNSYTEPLRNPNARLGVGPTRNTLEALLLHNNTRLHISVCTTEVITSFG